MTKKVKKTFFLRFVFLGFVFGRFPIKKKNEKNPLLGGSFSRFFSADFGGGVFLANPRMTCSCSIEGGNLTSDWIWFSLVSSSFWFLH